ncbi:MAG: ABC transporter permease [Planctomycetes bacterium]|nr:ABC transporter permease [Planctomycetota bacterium]
MRHALNRFLRSREFGVVVILLAMMVALEVGYRLQTHATFFTASNLARVTHDFSFVAIAAIGATAVILSGGIDLSAGSLIGLGAASMAFCVTKKHLAPELSFAVAAAAGLGLGAANGLMHAKLGLPPFIATLGMMWIARGIAYMFAPLAISIVWKSEGAPPSVLFTVLGDHTFWLLLALTVLAMLFVTFTKWGRYVYAIGGNEEAARFSGVPVQAMKVGIYAAAGLFSAVAGAAMALRYGSAHSGTASGYELEVIAAVVVGGVSLSGGQGSPAGAVLGALALKLLKELLIAYDVQPEYIQVVYGLAIVMAVALDHLARRGWSFGRRTIVRRTI